MIRSLDHPMPRRLLASCMMTGLLLAWEGAADQVRGQIRPQATPVRLVSDSDRLLNWRTEQVWEIRGNGRSGLLLSRLTPTDVVATPLNDVAVLDRLGRRVYLINSQGVVRDSLGREGRGPGEFMRPVNISVDPAGNLAVLDRDKGAFVRWRIADLATVEEIAGPSFFVGNGAQLVGSGFVYQSMQMLGAEGSRYQLYMGGAQRQKLAEAPVFQMTTARFPSCGGGELTVAPIFTPRVAWDSRGLRVVAAPGPSYRITIYHEARPLLVIERQVEPRRLTRALALRHLEGYQIGNCSVAAEEALRGMGSADLIPAVEELRLAPNGEIWAKRGTVQGEPDLIDIFSHEGEYIGTLRNVPFPAAFIGADRIVTISSDSMGVPVLTVLRVIRP